MIRDFGNQPVPVPKPDTVHGHPNVLCDVLGDCALAELPWQNAIHRSTLALANWDREVTSMPLVWTAVELFSTEGSELLVWNRNVTGRLISVEPCGGNPLTMSDVFLQLPQ